MGAGAAGSCARLVSAQAAASAASAAIEAVLLASLRIGDDPVGIDEFPDVDGFVAGLGNLDLGISYRGPFVPPKFGLRLGPWKW